MTIDEPYTPQLPSDASAAPMAAAHRIINAPSYAIAAISVLEQAGYEAWCVGGFVRDAILGRPIHDVDITTNALWQQTSAVFEAAGFAVYPTGAKHGTVTVVVDDQPVEITTYRTDGIYSDARHPDSVTFVSTVEEDLARRDFTINAMAWHPERGLRDPFGGAGDIAGRIIRAVGNAEQRFDEDALRILRGCRFASQLGFRLDGATLQAMRSCKRKLLGVSTERITAEFNRLLLGEHAHDALMECCDVLTVQIPELASMKGFEQHNPNHAFDLLEHTAYAVQNASATPLLRWAALLHDVGKPACFFVGDDGIGHFYGHEDVGARMAHDILKRFTMSDKFRAQVRDLVAYHDDEIAPTHPAVKRAMRKRDLSPEMFAALCQLKRADALAHGVPNDRARKADELLRVLDEIVSAGEALTVKSLAISGRDLLALGVPEGPQVGAALAAALEAVADDRVPNDRDALLSFVTAWVR